MGQSAETSTERWLAHAERRQAKGELYRRFFIREEHLNALNRFKTKYGLQNLDTALQLMLELAHETDLAASNRSGKPAKIRLKPKDPA